MNVVNRVGGTGAIGMDSVAKARPDGYTVGIITFNLSTYRLMGSPISRFETSTSSPCSIAASPACR